MSPEELDLLAQLDRIFADHPVYAADGCKSRSRARAFASGAGASGGWCEKLGLWAVRSKRNTSKPRPAHKISPYLLRGMTIDRPNQVWTTDITYLPLARGFLYLIASIDWATRRVLSCRLSKTLTASFCVEALACFGKAGIFNIDQGSRFTSDEFTQVLVDQGI